MSTDIVVHGEQISREDFLPVNERSPYWSSFWRIFVEHRDRKRPHTRTGYGKPWYAEAARKNLLLLRYHLDLDGENEIRASQGWKPKYPDGFWLGMPHGERTRVALVDIDNHNETWGSYPYIGRQVAINALTLDYLRLLKRTFDVLPFTLWCLSSKTYGVYALDVFDSPHNSRSVHNHHTQILQQHGLHHEVYPLGGRNNRLPFGLDFVTLGEAGPIHDFDPQMDNLLSRRVKPSWEAVYHGLVAEWIKDIERLVSCPTGVRNFRLADYHQRLDQFAEWEHYGFEIEEPHPVSIAIPETPSRASRSQPKASPLPWKVWKGQRTWIQRCVDLAKEGLPVPDCLYEAVVELAKWLLHIELPQGDDNHEVVVDTLMVWLKNKNNGMSSRLEDGEVASVRNQVERIVALSSTSKDFQGIFRRIRAKRCDGKYKQLINLLPILQGVVDQERDNVVLAEQNFFNPRETTENGPQGIEKREKRVLLSAPIMEQDRTPLADRLKPLLAKKKDARQRQLEFCNKLVGFLQDNLNEASIPQEIISSFGYAHHKQQDQAIKLLIKGNVITQEVRRYGEVRRFKLIEAPGGDERLLRGVDAA